MYIATPEAVKAAFEIITSDPHVSFYFLSYSNSLEILPRSYRYRSLLLSSTSLVVL